jgi:hypothetical protein
VGLWHGKAAYSLCDQVHNWTGWQWMDGGVCAPPGKAFTVWFVTGLVRNFSLRRTLQLTKRHDKHKTPWRRHMHGAAPTSIMIGLPPRQRSPGHLFSLIALSNAKYTYMFVSMSQSARNLTLLDVGEHQSSNQRNEPRYSLSRPELVLFGSGPDMSR